MPNEFSNTSSIVDSVNGGNLLIGKLSPKNLEKPRNNKVTRVSHDNRFPDNP